VEHELCVADEAGARTCISKAQLDRLLKMVQTAAVEPPAKTNDRMATSVAESVIESVTEPAKIEATVESTVDSTVQSARMPTAPAAEQAAVVEPAQSRRRHAVSNA
jgi:hypothetical protein